MRKVLPLVWLLSTGCILAAVWFADFRWLWTGLIIGFIGMVMFSRAEQNARVTSGRSTGRIDTFTQTTRPPKFGQRKEDL